VSAKRKKKSVVPILLLGLGITIVVAAISASVFLAVIWFTTNAENLMPLKGVPTPLDGSGRGAVTPDVVEAGGHVDGYTISYIVGEHGLMDGATIYLFYPSQVIAHGDKEQMYMPYLAWKSIREFMFIPISVQYDGKARLSVERPSIMHHLRLIFGYYRSERENGKPAYTVDKLVRELVRKKIKVTGSDIAPGDEITINIGGSEGMSVPDYAGWVNFSMSVDGDGDGIDALVGASPRTVIVGRKTKSFRVVATSVVNIYERIRVVVEAVDEDGQIDPTYTGTVYLDSPKLALPGQASFEVADMGRKVFNVRTSREGVFFITARDQRKRRGRSNPIIIREAGPHLYWGDLHIHSVIGMGDNPPEASLRKARDELELDFAAVNMMDNGVPLASHEGIGSSERAEFGWEHLQKITRLFNKSGKFVAFPAFNWASNSFGHRLVIYNPGELEAELLNHTDPRYSTVEKLLRGLAGRGAMVIPIWSAWRGGKFMGKRYDWGPLSSRHQRLIEVYSSDGAVEFCDNPFPIHGSMEVPRLFGPSDQASCSSGAFVRDILSQGARFGLIAGGARRFSLERPPFYSHGLTAVWAKKLTRSDVWVGLYGRKVYGTTGARIFIELKIGGASPGAEVSAANALPVEVFIVGTAPIERAQLIRFGERYTETRALSSKTEILHTKWMEKNPPRGGFYFLRVKQTDGHMAWVGPVWVSR